MRFNPSLNILRHDRFDPREFAFYHQYLPTNSVEDPHLISVMYETLMPWDIW